MARGREAASLGADIVAGSIIAGGAPNGFLKKSDPFGN
jgi:hypothetical protein